MAFRCSRSLLLVLLPYANLCYVLNCLFPQMFISFTMLFARNLSSPRREVPPVGSGETTSICPFLNKAAKFLLNLVLVYCILTFFLFMNNKPFSSAMSIINFKASNKHCNNQPFVIYCCQIAMRGEACAFINRRRCNEST